MKCDISPACLRLAPSHRALHMLISPFRGQRHSPPQLCPHQHAAEAQSASRCAQRKGESWLTVLNSLTFSPLPLSARGSHWIWPLSTVKCLVRGLRTERKGAGPHLFLSKKMSSHIRWLVIQRCKACSWVWCTIIGYPRVDTVCYRTDGKFGIELIIVSLESVWWAFCTCEGAFTVCLCQCDQCNAASEGRSNHYTESLTMQCGFNWWTTTMHNYVYPYIHYLCVFLGSFALNLVSYTFNCLLEEEWAVTLSC